MPSDPAFSETTAYQPNSPYSASKAGSDHLVRAYHHTYGLETTTSNCSNNYGPFQFPEKLVPLMIANALEGKKLGLFWRVWLTRRIIGLYFADRTYLHLKESATADLPATARPITETAEREQVLDAILAALSSNPNFAEPNRADWLATSPLVEVTFDA